MKKLLTKENLSFILNIVLGVALLVGLFAYVALAKEKSSMVDALKKSEENLVNLEFEKKQLSVDLAVARGDASDTKAQIEGLSETLEKLKKLAETDRELLRQYSKVYFLSENYIPRGLTEVSPVFLQNADKQQYILALVYPFLQRLLEQAAEDGMDLKILSAYRSFEEQSGLKNAYTVTYGSGTANKFSADQGYSEHQLGTTVDFTTTKLGSSISSFAKTKEYTWLKENAYKHGFVLSYPENNPSYVYEPWHWRFVGLQLAQRLREEKQDFYTLEQRQIDPYLINLFESSLE